MKLKTHVYSLGFPGVSVAKKTLVNAGDTEGFNPWGGEGRLAKKMARNMFPVFVQKQ